MKKNPKEPKKSPLPVKLARQPSSKITQASELKQIGKILTESAAESTTHGIDHMFKREHIGLRIFWLICFLASTAVCAYMISLSIAAYFRHETVTKVEQVRQLSTDFPSVSVCNQNPFLTNFSYEFAKQVLVENGVISPISPEATFDYLFYDTLIVFRYFIGTNALDPNRTEDFRKKMGYSLKDILLSCTFNLDQCNVDDFVWFYDVLHGNCYKFNSGKYANLSAAPVFRSTKAGFQNGLSLELFLYEPDNVLSLSTTNGLHVVVQNQTSFPVTLDGLSISSGSQTNVEVRRVVSSYLEKPFSDCIQDLANYPSQLVQAVLSVDYTYTQQNCFHVCFQRFSVSICNCYDPSLPIRVSLITDRTDIGPCISFNQTKCNAQYYSLFFSDDVNSKCGPECPLECDSITYKLYTSQAEYPSQVYAESLMKNPVIKAKYASDPSKLTLESLKRNLAQLSVYYGDLGYQHFDEVAKTGLGDLISGIGGTLGLFLGMSFLSFAEIFDVFLQIFILKVSKKNHIQKNIEKV